MLFATISTRACSGRGPAQAGRAEAVRPEAGETFTTASGAEQEHPVVARGLELGLEAFGSPTCSNQTLCPFPTLKIGPGDSARSHTADEYIGLDEIERGIEVYVTLLDGLDINP